MVDLSRQFAAFHATTDQHVESILRGQRANTRGGIETYGPGFYTFHDREAAEDTARFRAEKRGGSPVVIEGLVRASSPISKSTLDLQRMDRAWAPEFRQQYDAEGIQHIRESRARRERPDTGEIPGMHNVNYLLRQRGHDYLHIDQSVKNRPDIGLVLRPGRFTPTAVHRL